MAEDVIEKVERLLQRSDLRVTAPEVGGFLRLVRARDEQIARLSGPPRLIEPETLAESYAGMFHRAMFDMLDMLEGNQVTLTLRRPSDRGYLKRLRDSSQLVAVKHGNRYVYPSFQLDVDHHRVRPAVAAVNLVLHARRDPWGALAWWTAANPRWGGRRPIDHLDDDQVVELAEVDTADDGF